MIVVLRKILVRGTYFSSFTSILFPVLLVVRGVVGCPGLVVVFIFLLLFINVYFEWLAQINPVHWWSAVVVSTGGHYIGYDQSG